MTAEPSKKGDDWSLPLVGLFLLTMVGGLLYIQLSRELVASIFYDETRCVILDKRVVENPSRRADG